MDKVKITIQVEREELLSILSQYPAPTSKDKEALELASEVDLTEEARKALYMPTRTLLKMAVDKLTRG